MNTYVTDDEAKLIAMLCQYAMEKGKLAPVGKLAALHIKMTAKPIFAGVTMAATGHPLHGSAETKRDEPDHDG